MRILLTGASSFTGCWFAESLVAAGHTVVAPLRGGLNSGADQERTRRLARITSQVELIPDCAFGSTRFLDLVQAGTYDLLNHHAADVGDYRSSDYDVTAAVAKNTFNMARVLDGMQRRGLVGVVLTGSFFEADEGAGNEPRQAFSLYGLSKGLTASVVRHRCHERGLPYAKFVIPHPFGVLEQPRLGAYLARAWRAGKVAEVKTPAYVRDNIPVSLLAAAYARFVGEFGRDPKQARTRLNPSGYVESQGAFVQRLASEVGRRIARECPVRLLHQTEFPEPVMRVNTDPAAAYVAAWNEAKAWDEYAEEFRG